MASVKPMVALRNEIDNLMNESFQKRDGGALSTDDILREVKRRLKLQIAAAEPSLIDVALKRLIDSVGRRKPGRQAERGERDLFGEYPNIPQTITVGEKKRKRIGKLSIAEAIGYLDSHSPKAVSERYEALKRLVNDCLPFKMSDADTIEVLIDRKKIADTEDSGSAFGWSNKVTANARNEELALIP